MRVLALVSLVLLLLQPACSSTSIGDPGGALSGGPGTGFTQEPSGVGGTDTGGGGQPPTGARDSIASAADYYNAGGEGRADLDEARDGSAEPGPAPVDGDEAPADGGDLAPPEVTDGLPSDLPPADAGDTTGADGTDPGTTPGDSAEPADVDEPDAPEDQGPPAEDATEDTSADLPFTWPENAPPPQCRQDSDCPTGMCSRSAPGGICTGCGVAADCPADHDCNIGGCNLWCSSDDECPVAMRCHPTRGDCVLTSCGEDADCEGPYVCEGDKCRRPTCGEADACPEPLTCEDGVCVEP